MTALAKLLVGAVFVRTEVQPPCPFQGLSSEHVGANKSKKRIVDGHV